MQPPFHADNTVELMAAFDQDSVAGGREEGIVGVLCVRTQNPLEGLLIPAGLETPRDPPRRSLEDVAGAALLSLLPPQLGAVRAGQKKNRADRLPRTTKGTVRVLEWRLVDRRCLNLRTHKYRRAARPLPTL